MKLFSDPKSLVFLLLKTRLAPRSILTKQVGVLFSDGCLANSTVQIQILKFVHYSVTKICKWYLNARVQSCGMLDCQMTTNLRSNNGKIRASFEARFRL